MVSFRETVGKLISPRKPMEVGHGKGYRTESDTGMVSSSRTWTDRLPHPNNMGNYDEWANDPEASIAFNVLTDIIAGVGYYTEMPEEEKEDHKNKKRIDEYGEDVNLDEDLQEIVMAMLQKGFCPVERLEDYDLKILPPESFYIYRDKKGKVLKYTQEYSQNEVVNEWKGKEMDDIILFFHRRTTSWPYGKSLVEPIGPLLDERAQMNKDMPKAVHRWAYPIPFVWTKGSRDKIQKACEDRDLDDWIFLGNALKEEFGFDTLGIDPQARFIPYIELIYYQICEGLHAPLLLYLKNATEASATVMMESVDRLVNGIQRYVKRRVERYLFEPQCSEPVPRLVWGQPKTGLEEIELDQVANLYASGALKFNQVQDVLKQLGLKLPEPEEEEWEKSLQKQPFQPFQKKPSQQQIQIPAERLLAKLKDLGTVLDVINLNFREKRIPLIQAMRQGGEAIEVYCKRMHPHDKEAFEKHRDEEFQRWRKRLVGKEGHVYSVSVGD